jgi:hypothetical protein
MLARLFGREQAVAPVTEALPGLPRIQPVSCLIPEKYC